jgi:hypothetical protein
MIFGTSVIGKGLKALDQVLLELNGVSRLTQLHAFERNFRRRRARLA